ncbi:MAG: glycerol-3-phosphate 1-O-acyltransferase PlsY [Gemmataceae bacterium]
MTSTLIAILVWIVSYLVGAIPFGYVVGKLKGVDLFKTGSGNIGATNVGRVLGKPCGIFVFVLDFIKGAGPALLAEPIAKAMNSGEVPFGDSHFVQVGAAAVAFLGHLFPIYLGFKGGKGVATGAGAVLIVAPFPAMMAVLAWIATVLSTRMVSAASIAAVVMLVLTRIGFVPNPWGISTLAGTVFCIVGSLFVVVKHRSNISRILSGTENQISDSPRRLVLMGSLHCLAVGLWFGGAAFFNFMAAPAIFDSFKNVVDEQPSDRTGGMRILDENADAETRKKLANALAGAAVGPIFPLYFKMMAACGMFSVITAWAWRSQGKRHRVRFVVLLCALILVAIGWPVSEWVTQLRLERISTDPRISEAAIKQFGPAHMISLGLSMLTNLLTGMGLFLAGQLPQSAVPREKASTGNPSTSNESA